MLLANSEEDTCRLEREEISTQGRSSGHREKTGFFRSKTRDVFEKNLYRRYWSSALTNEGRNAQQGISCLTFSIIRLRRKSKQSNCLLNEQVAYLNFPRYPLIEESLSRTNPFKHERLRQRRIIFFLSGSIPSVFRYGFSSFAVCRFILSRLV